MESNIYIPQWQPHFPFAGLPPTGDFNRHDMSGLFAIPGLVDAHGHLTGGPQRVTTDDGEMLIEITAGDEFTRINGLVALAFGATSVRNPGGSTEAAARYDARLASGVTTPESR